ncbi:hypothetical protein GCM10018793_31040 [Streptomyces sulfonofaciens]|uniref:Uncharacterized protein n=1 Tax=Streptomyces sulfonofaciens TaxID=68272 RepID=A0A919G6V3_9ACTN|nr:hypothetical protein [Streptomyces sulfonofaciens]GHH79115.1 hypothetical protein GCM10018793_31040 [Streptomyces sulfonofaciens]
MANARPGPAEPCAPMDCAPVDCAPDALRHYELLLAAAEDVFGRLGTDAPLEAVAQQAAGQRPV